MKKNFNLIIVGYGGQGILTAAEIVSLAALKQEHDVKETELHGLAQRGGSLDCHIRFGKKVFSPLVPRGEADLIIAFEALEALRACYWAGKNTKIIVSSKAFRSSAGLNEILSKIVKITKKIYIVDADSAVKKETGSAMGVNIFLLGYALSKKAIPLKEEFVLQAIKESIRPRFLEENINLFRKGEKNDRGYRRKL